MKFTQSQSATITLGATVAIGEYEGHVTNAKPGNYRVYEVQRETGSKETALLFVHEDNTQDINELLPTVDVDAFCGVDGGTYGLVTKSEKDEYSEWSERWFDCQNHTDGYVANTIYGDGDFSVYTNEDHSVFLLDDEDIYLQTLLADHNINYEDDLENMNWFSFTDEYIKVVYRTPLTHESTTLKRPIDTSIRKIDNIVSALVDVAQLTRINTIVNELEDESQLTQDN